MAEPQAPPATKATQPTRPTVYGLIAKHGHTPARVIMDFVRLGAAAQAELRPGGPTALSRSTALWAIVHLDADIADALAVGVIRAEVGMTPALESLPPPADVPDTEVDENLAHALDTGFGALPRATMIDLTEITYALLRDYEARGGWQVRSIGDASADVDRALASLRRLRSTAPPEPAEPPAISQATGIFLGYYEALRGGRLDAAGIDGSALWPALSMVASQGEGTVATPVVLSVLRLRRGSASKGGGDISPAAFGVVRHIAPVAVDEIDLANHPLLRLASVVRDRIEPDEVIHLRHLVATVLDMRFAPVGPETRDRDIGAARTALLDQLRRDAPPDVVARWEAYFAGEAPEPAVARAPVGRAVAGVAADLVDDGTTLSDELGVVGDVVTLCDMVAARGAAPPISVGLFGRWGSGKSYFMALMRRRIDELRNAAVAARRQGEETAYCSEIVQVTFNAWHYMDADDLWATLAVHLFGAIAQVDPDDDRARPRADVVRDLQTRERRMETVDRQITRALGDRRLDAAAERTGVASTREEALGLLGELGTAIGYASAGKVLLTKAWWTRRRRRWVVAFASLSLLLVALAGLIASGAVPAGWLAAVVPLAGTLVGTATTWLRRIKDGLAEVNRVAAEAGLQPRDLTGERIAKDSEVVELLAELHAIDQLGAIRDWVRERALSSDYTSHFGVISVLRGDLEALVEKQRSESQHRRIILYIDDLDRCEPARVVEVLQAVHLLLAFPLFVAVVGVDPRWLLRSLERHYRQVLSTADGGHARAMDDLLTESTPHDYLEKIFQIPFSLRPMEPEGYGRLITSLAGAEPGGTAEGSTRTMSDDLAGAVATRGLPVAPETDGADGADGADSANGANGVGGADGVGSEAQAGRAAEQVRGPASAPAPASAVGAEAAAEVAPVAVNPPQLQVTGDEVAALAHVGPLIGTPRAAKRLVNLYRLIRAGLSDAEVDRFVADQQYRSLAIVLAVQVGFARIASVFLAQLVKGEASVVTSVSLQQLTPPVDVDRSEWEALQTALRSVCLDADGDSVPGFDRPLGELRAWIPRLRRYSFEGALGPS